MRTQLARTWLLWLLLLAAVSPSWAATFTVTVGGSTGSSDGYGTNPVLAFSPRNLTITAGDTVMFTNAGGSHNVAADDGSFRCAQGCDGHGGSGNISPAAWSSTVAFNQAGTFPFHCEAHGSMGMTGSITVQAATPGNVPITGGFTGAWYDPIQGGHGILMEVLPSGQLFAYWFTFNPDGQQAWFGGTGPIVGNSATVTVDLGTGGRWIPNFNPATYVLNPWGTLTFTFTDCAHGRVDFSSTYGTFGSNHMDLVRLTEPVGITCP
ncbi:MAG: plastocyanin/azurin family copper-binding protein [Dokdonella sp.]